MRELSCAESIAGDGERPGSPLVERVSKVSTLSIEATTHEEPMTESNHGSPWLGAHSKTNLNRVKYSSGFPAFASASTWEMSRDVSDAWRKIHSRAHPNVSNEVVTKHAVPYADSPEVGEVSVVAAGEEDDRRLGSLTVDERSHAYVVAFLISLEAIGLPFTL